MIKIVGEKVFFENLSGYIFTIFVENFLAWAKFLQYNYSFYPFGNIAILLYTLSVRKRGQKFS